MPFGEFLDQVEGVEQNGESLPFYMGKNPLAEELPELVDDIEAASGSPIKRYGGCFGPNNKGVYTYFGSGHNTTGIHFDPSENLVLLVSGTKTFDLFPPWEADCLYPSGQKNNFASSAVPPLLAPGGMPKELEARYP